MMSFSISSGVAPGQRVMIDSLGKLHFGHELNRHRAERDQPKECQQNHPDVNFDGMLNALLDEFHNREIDRGRTDSRTLY